jgi:hypothetical protein
MRRLLLGRWPLLFLLLGGIGLLILAESVDFGSPAKEILKGLAEGLVVAAILGALVERPLRRIFAEEIAEDVFLTIFGMHAPREYIRGLERVCRTDRLSYDVGWTISVDWHERPTTLAVRMDCHNQVFNIGREPQVPKGLWLMGSAPGTPGSRFARYEMSIGDADNREGRRWLFNEDELAKLAIGRGTDISIEREELLGANVTVPPGGYTRSVTTGLIYLALPGVIPLVQNYPALKVRFEFGGGALGELDLKLQSGTETIDLDGSDGRLKGETKDLALPGSTFQLRFNHENAPLVAGATSAE